MCMAPPRTPRKRLGSIGSMVWTLASFGGIWMSRILRSCLKKNSGRGSLPPPRIPTLKAQAPPHPLPPRNPFTEPSCSWRKPGCCLRMLGLVLLTLSFPTLVQGGRVGSNRCVGVGPRTTDSGVGPSTTGRVVDPSTTGSGVYPSTAGLGADPKTTVVGSREAGPRTTRQRTLSIFHTIFARWGPQAEGF